MKIKASLEQVQVIWRFWEKASIGNACWIWKSVADKRKSHFPYGRFWVGGRKGRYEMAHRVAYSMMVGEIPEGMILCHRCDTPNCVRPSHLFVATHSANSADMVKKGRSLKGEYSPRAKLDQNSALMIRDLFRRGISKADLGEMFGVTRQNITHIVNGGTWNEN